MLSLSPIFGEALTRARSSPGGTRTQRRTRMAVAAIAHAPFAAHAQKVNLSRLTHWSPENVTIPEKAAAPSFPGSLRSLCSSSKAPASKPNAPPTPSVFAGPDARGRRTRGRRSRGTRQSLRLGRGSAAGGPRRRHDVLIPRFGLRLLDGRVHLSGMDHAVRAVQLLAQIFAGNGIQRGRRSWRLAV